MLSSSILDPKKGKIACQAVTFFPGIHVFGGTQSSLSTEVHFLIITLVTLSY